MKQDKYDRACSTFEGTGIKINTDGQRYLRGSLGTASYAESYAQSKIAIWEKKLTSLYNIAISQPHAAYAAFTHGLAHKWNFWSRTITNIGHFLQLLETMHHSRQINPSSNHKTWSTRGNQKSPDTSSTIGWTRHCKSGPTSPRPLPSFQKYCINYFFNAERAGHDHSSRNERSHHHSPKGS